MNASEFIVRPFLKWAGGKRWLVGKYSHLFPTSYTRYIEPFLGSGAVFFYLKPKKAILSDINDDLIVAYEGLKNEYQKVEEELKRHHRNHSPEYFYKIREYLPRALHTRAARLIYLNRTCWNGLYRVNRNGQFNVPIGTKENAVLPTDNFSGISLLLKQTEICKADFEITIDRAKSGDFLFVDPPYTVKHNLNGFVKYNETIFSWDDQIRLSKSLLRAMHRGAEILMTNANHESIRKLYRKDFHLESVARNSVISGLPHGRSICRELIVRS